MSSLIKEEMMLNESLASSSSGQNASRRVSTVSTASNTPPTDSQATLADSEATMDGDHAAMQSLGAHSHRLIQGIKNLQDLNINNTLPSLPKFVVVGDQSAGKSSIVEALCDISLPRAHGTCTRCPFLITTSAQSGNTQWACHISIKRYYQFQAGQFFELAEPDTTHFTTVTEKQQLESMLRKAQLAILNPQANPQSFVAVDLKTVDLSASRKVAFSPNVICLEIQGPNLPELSFFDLPGSINVIEDGEDPSLVDVIERLVTAYLKDDMCRILLACGADQDVETSTTFRSIKNCNATGRCAGVLTKADLLQSGKADYIQQILSGKKFALKQGWYITKQLSQIEIDAGVDHNTARARELSFFAREPWTSFPGVSQQRFGIGNLQEAVSRGMTEHIRGQIPEILSRVQDRLSDVSQQLQLLPERPIHPTFTVIHEVQQLASNIGHHVRGESDVNEFRKTFEDMISRFKKQLSESKPTIDMKTPGYKAPDIVLSSDDEEAMNATPSRMPIRTTPSSASSRKRPAESTPSSRRIKAESAAPAVQKQAYTLENLRRKYDRGNTSGVPGSINSKVTDRLILLSLNSWDVIVDHLLKDANTQIENLVAKSVTETLASRQKTLFYERTSDVLRAFIAKLMHDASDRLHFLVLCEQEKPVTHSNWAGHKSSRMREFGKLRTLQRVHEYFETQEADKTRTTPNEKRAEKAKDTNWVASTLNDDDWAIEIDCIATITVYYDIATMCFVDTVAKNLEFGVLRPLRCEIEQTLLRELNANDATECAELLAEDPEREKLRNGLVAEKAKLEQAMDELKTLSEI